MSSEEKKVADITAIQSGQLTVIHIKLPKPINVTEASIVIEGVSALKHIVAKGKLLVLSGRGPIWMYCMLLHSLLHVVPAIAVFDPKVGGAIVVASHTQEYREGQIVELPEEIRTQLTEV